MTLDDYGIRTLQEALDAPDLEGDRYRVRFPLGHGGMGAVYLAEDTLLGRQVAIKVLHLEDTTDDGIARMTREARTLARLEHPGIVPIHDFGRLVDGRVYYAMKWVRGKPLSRHVTASTPLAERLRLFLKVAETVAFAHAAGVLHRDLKPENIMVGEFGEVLVLDWGIARWTAEPDAERPGTVAGTPAYMAPEQEAGDAHLDVRADVYGLGATLRFLATGRAPDAPEPVAMPGALAAVVAKATAPDAAARYASVAELAADVERFLEGSRVLAHAEGLGERIMRFVRRYRVPIGLVIAYLVMRVAIWLALRR